jgi:hypothetical protein
MSQKAESDEERGSRTRTREQHTRRTTHSGAADEKRMETQLNPETSGGRHPEKGTKDVGEVYEHEQVGNCGGVLGQE